MRTIKYNRALQCASCGTESAVDRRRRRAENRARPGRAAQRAPSRAAGRGKNQGFGALGSRLHCDRVSGVALMPGVVDGGDRDVGRGGAASAPERSSSNRRSRDPGSSSNGVAARRTCLFVRRVRVCATVCAHQSLIMELRTAARLGLRARGARPPAAGRAMIGVQSSPHSCLPRLAPPDQPM